MLAAILALLMLLPLNGCGAESGTRFVSPVAHRLPAYTPAEAALFDDSIALEVFGHPSGRGDPERDPKLIESAQKADAIARVKVVTVTRDVAGDRLAFALLLKTVGRPLVGALPSDPQEIEVSPDNAAVVLIQTNEGRLVGRTLIALVRRYNDAGEATVHYRLEPDTEAVARAVKRALTLDELR